MYYYTYTHGHPERICVSVSETANLIASTVDNAPAIRFQNVQIAVIAQNACRQQQLRLRRIQCDLISIMPVNEETSAVAAAELRSQKQRAHLLVLTATHTNLTNLWGASACESQLKLARRATNQQKRARVSQFA